MSVSPFDAPVALYLTHADALEEACSALFFPDGSGSAMDALTARIARHRAATLQLSRAARDISDACDEQAFADTVLASPVTRDDLQEQRKVFQSAVAAGDTAHAAQEKVLLDEMWETRKAKKEAHAGQCSATDTALSDVDLDTGTVGTGTGSPGRAAGGNEGLGEVQELPGSVDPEALSARPETTNTSVPEGPVLSDTDAGTDLSSDAGVSIPSQPALSPMTGAGAFTPQQQSPMTGGGAFTASQTPATGASATAPARSRDTRNSGTPTTRTRGTALSRPRKRDTDDRTSPPTDGTVVAGTVDRGSSNAGTTTRADTTGSAKTNLSANTAPPAAPVNASPMMGRGVPPMGGGGPAMGSGGSIAGMTKQNPTILTRDPNLTGFDKDSIDNGTLSRDTASTPDFEAWSDVREVANTKQDR